MSRSLAVAAFLPTAVIALVCVAAARSAAPGVAPPAGGPPVLVELFTSEGCSSCPPADALLTRIGADRELAIVPLAFHVDYWNHLGWSDPFSSHRWSLRQSAYAQALRRDEVYTPQAIVGGAADVNGSDERALRRMVAAARSRAGEVRLDGTARRGDDGVRVDVRAAVPAGTTAGALRLVVVLYENGLATAVGAGENTGRTLREDYVVRDLREAGALPARSGATAAARVTLSPGRAVPAALGVAVFAQDPSSLHVHGAAMLAVS